jgi:hypothetical protein
LMAAYRDKKVVVLCFSVFHCASVGGVVGCDVDAVARLMAATSV